MSTLPNKSKTLDRADDSAAKLLMELLDGSPGRNFDIESMFVERRADGSWRFIIFEFLKAETVPPEASHPNFYWRKNKRKFLSLWAVTKALRQAGFRADLVLVNYDERRTQVKVMKVNEITEQPSEVFREAQTRADGTASEALMRWVATTDRIMPFSEFKKKFKKYNDTKQGDTWELLGEL